MIAADICPGRLETARRLRADAAVVEATGREGAAATAAACTRRGRRVIVVGLPAKPQLLELSRLTLGEIDLIATVAHVCKVDLPEALSMLASGDLAEVVVDRVAPLSSIVEDGLEPLAAGAVDGKILLPLTA